LAGKVLGMATAFGGSKLASIEIVNHILSSISLARVSQWAVLISPGASPEHYRFGDFIYGNIELEKLEYRSEKAGSDFARRYGQSLQSRRSILREGRELKLIDVNAIKTTTSPGASSRNFMYRIFDDYYANVASIEREVFMLDLDRQQAVFGAAGLGTIPSETPSYDGSDDAVDNDLRAPGTWARLGCAGSDRDASVVNGTEGTCRWLSRN